jgi:hypothetical protein
MNLEEFEEPALAEVDAAPYGVGDQTEPVPRRTRPVAAHRTRQMRRVRCRHQSPRITVRAICRRLDADADRHRPANVPHRLLCTCPGHRGRGGYNIAATTNAQNRSPGPKRPTNSSINNTLDRSGKILDR